MAAKRPRSSTPLATAVSGSLIAAMIATVAVVSGGYPAQKLDLADGSVWVVNGERQLLGRANPAVAELNSVVGADSAELDVVQHGSTVLLWDHGNSRVDVVEPATSTVIDTVPLPTDRPTVLFAGSTVVISGVDGELWLLSPDELVDFDAESEPTLNLGPRTVVASDADGGLYAFSQSAGQLYRIDARGSQRVEETVPLVFGDENSELSVSWVSGHWAVLDARLGLLWLDGRVIELGAFVDGVESLRLQKPSRDAAGLLLAHSRGLLEVSFADGGVSALVEGRAGFAATPVELDGCRFAAWSDGTAWRNCGGGRLVELELAQMPFAASRLSFAVNGEQLVLNDPAGGGTWVVQDRGQLIDNWEALAVLDDEQEEVVDADPDTPPDFEKVQQPPVALDDEFGARAGRSAILPVLLNDYDPNGDVLAITQVSVPSHPGARIDVINNRQQLQLSLDASVIGTVTFSYTISDGRGGEDRATVTVTVRSASENSPPQQVRQTQGVVAAGGRLTLNVLGDWVDPDGDPIYLASASVLGPDAVTYKSDGIVVLQEAAGGVGRRTIALVVTDGTAQGTGTVTVSVYPSGQAPIVVDSFVTLGYAGQELTVSPLDHVRGGSGPARLSSVSAITGAIVTPSLDAGTFRFLSQQPRSYLVEFVVTDGFQTATGIARIDVLAPPDANTKPITVPKTVFVKTLSSETVDVASSDIDPAGGVLLVTGVESPPTSAGVHVEVLEQRSVRVVLTAPLDAGPVTVRYRVSNGLAEADGVITVVEIPQPARLQPPVASDDSVSVRVGAAIDIRVLDNDVHPDGETLTLSPRLRRDLASGSGLLFTSGSVLRYLAPDAPGDYTASYEVTGPDGQAAQAQVTIAVRERVEATNKPPVPETLTARVLAGSTVLIRVPLASVDPDGDTVQLLGVASNPSKGSVSLNGSDTIAYTAGEYSAGTDVFAYTIMDALGARATGTVRVGIGPRQEGARNPIATEDAVSMRPGGTVTIQVLGNDSDPDGSRLEVVLVVPNDEEVAAETDGEVVRVTPPAAPGDYGLIYTIRNAFGGTSQNFITVTVDPDAPLARPYARDSVLSLTDVLDRESVDVNVLANVFFADGPVTSLELRLLPGFDAGVSVTADKRIRVRVGDRSQIVPFAVAHPDDPTIVAYAFVWVPGYDDALPQVNRAVRPLTIASESVLTIPLNNYVIAIGGKQVRLTDTSTVQATHSDGTTLVIDEQTLRFRSADKYFGPASISFQVTDGTSANDPNGRVATLVLPITVTPRENQPPVFGGAVLDFEPGEEKVLDLVRLTTYPYPDDLDELAYTALAPLPVGFSYTLTGQSLSIRADASAVKGTTTSLVLGVRDALTEGKAGSIQLNVVASTRPLAKPAPDTAVVQRGKTTVVDVLGNDEATNPFPGQALQVGEIRGIDGASLPPGVTVLTSGDRRRLSVTVAPDALAQDIHIQYQVIDATRDPDRYVWGSVKLQIQDVPDAVSNVRVTSFGDRRLVVAWNAGSFNNSPITSYEVTSTITETGAVHQVVSCTVTSGCELSTPGNGQANRLRIAVVAINAIGPSEPASPSRSFWSDVLPAAPTGLTVTPTAAAPAGGSFQLAWDAVADPVPGTAVTGYVVRITGPSLDISRSIAATDPARLDVLNTEGVLQAGVQYTFTVYARNGAQVQSESEWRRAPAVSLTAIGPPGLVAGGVTATVINGQGHIQVGWGAASPGGASSVSYGVGRIESSQEPPASCAPGETGLSGPTTSGWVDTTVGDSVEYRYLVFASNSLYCTVSVSGAVLTMRVPGVASGTASVLAHGGQFDIRAGTEFSVASSTAAKYQFRFGTGAWADVVPSQWLTSLADSSVYGQVLSVSFRGCRDLSDQFCGEPSESIEGLRPVNARAGILSCVVGALADATPPLNAGTPAVGYRWSFHDGALDGVWTPFTEDATVPAPDETGTGIVGVRVKATVTFGVEEPRIDQEYAEGTCQP